MGEDPGRFRGPRGGEGACRKQVRESEARKDLTGRSAGVGGGGGAPSPGCRRPLQLDRLPLEPADHRPLCCPLVPARRLPTWELGGRARVLF